MTPRFRLLAALAAAAALLSLALPWATIGYDAPNAAPPAEVRLGALPGGAGWSAPVIVLLALSAGLAAWGALERDARWALAAAAAAGLAVATAFLALFYPLLQAPFPAELTATPRSGPLAAALAAALGLVAWHEGGGRARKEAVATVAAVALLAGAAVAAPTALQDGFDRQPAIRSEGGDGDALHQVREGPLAIYPEEPVLVRLTSAAGDTNGSRPLDASLSASAAGGGEVSLLVRPLHDDAGGFAATGDPAEGPVAAPGATADFLLYARADRPVEVRLDGAAWVSTRNLGWQEDGWGVSVTGVQESHALDVGFDTLSVEVSAPGAGTVVLLDPEGRERARVSAGGAYTAWTLAHPPGEWTLACEGVCTGEARVRVVSTHW